MPAYKDAQKGTWYAAFYYQDWKGIKKKKLKRGFPTKKEALAWERTFLLQQAADLTMTFEAFVEIYIVDKQNRLRENTWSTKEHIYLWALPKLESRFLWGSLRTRWPQDCPCGSTKSTKERYYIWHWRTIMRDCSGGSPECSA